mmetsp:Transcript_7502/g.19258  ORF Transcript_7502/g.19258 Transcript_7502/m.19258 type:complete len:221 (+) Transcript_7502:797-1459(+)
MYQSMRLYDCVTWPCRSSSSAANAGERSASGTISMTSCSMSSRLERTLSSASSLLSFFCMRLSAMRMSLTACSRPRCSRRKRSPGLPGACRTETTDCVAAPPALTRRARSGAADTGRGGCSAPLGLISTSRFFGWLYCSAGSRRDRAPPLSLVHGSPLKSANSSLPSSGSSSSVAPVSAVASTLATALTKAVPTKDESGMKAYTPPASAARSCSSRLAML